MRCTCAQKIKCIIWSDTAASLQSSLICMQCFKCLLFCLFRKYVADRAGQPVSFGGARQRSADSHNTGRTVDSKESHVLPAICLAYNALQTTMHHDLPHNSLMPDHSHPSKNFQQFASRYHYGYQYMVEISYSHLILSDLLCQCKTSTYLIRYG